MLFQKKSGDFDAAVEENEFIALMEEKEPKEDCDKEIDIFNDNEMVLSSQGGSVIPLLQGVGMSTLPSSVPKVATNIRVLKDFLKKIVSQSSSLKRLRRE